MTADKAGAKTSLIAGRTEIIFIPQEQEMSKIFWSFTLHLGRLVEN